MATGVPVPRRALSCTVIRPVAAMTRRARYSLLVLTRRPTTSGWAPWPFGRLSGDGVGRRSVSVRVVAPSQVEWFGPANGRVMAPDPPLTAKSAAGPAVDHAPP